MCKHKVEINLAPDVVVTYCKECGDILDVKERVIFAPAPIPIYPYNPWQIDPYQPHPWYEYTWSGDSIDSIDCDENDTTTGWNLNILMESDFKWLENIPSIFIS